MSDITDKISLLKKLHGATIGGRGTMQAEARLFDACRDCLPEILAEVDASHTALKLKESRIQSQQAEIEKLRAGCREAIEAYQKADKYFKECQALAQMEAKERYPGLHSDMANQLTGAHYWRTVNNYIAMLASKIAVAKAALGESE